MPRSSMWSLCQDFSMKCFYICPVHFIILDLWWWVCYKVWSSSPCNFLQTSVATPLVIILSASFKTQSIVLPLAEGPSLHPKAAGKIIVLYILSFRIIGRREEDERFLN
jgi:hypothetical protein